ncbi:MAG: peptidoglycan DD-metalloendopeptidase family protein, partial [Betaproteobacteria bacterium]|nr:peptidoglycan DD-metalloendopeptidase family protein [Betaproteobacteria bacterium]MDE2154232.1 peptidoglycan DD-metalloendopeptidase family protein [Betaproteobacteria bacterium]
GARREAASAAAPAAARPAPAPSGPATPSAGAHAVAGGLSWSWPAQGRIAQGYNGGTSKGLDIAGKAGEPVRAAAAGKVVYAGNELRGFGNLVIVKHNADYISVYAHNQKLLVHEGEEVRRGQTVALMGSTDAPRVELHFEVRLRGKPIDPTQVLPPR